jgi:DNA-binding transcriptional ArsR family regulator
LIFFATSALPTERYSTGWLTMSRLGYRFYSTEWLNSKEGNVTADPLSRVFSALADPTRRDIVARLAAGDATVNELAEPYDVSVQAISKHLKVLEDAGLVSRSRQAQRRPVHLEAEVFDLMTKWIERYRQQAEERYRRLDDVLRSMPDDVEPIPTSTPITKGTKT